MESIEKTLLQISVDELALSSALRFVLLYNQCSTLEKLFTNHLSAWLHFDGMNYHLYEELLSFIRKFSLHLYVNER